jgi:hypothetical protein
LVPQDSSWHLISARDITNFGFIVGYGRINGEMHGFLLKPNPEPKLVDLGITGPEDVRESYYAQYQVIAYYEGGYTRNVTEVVEWLVEPEGVASIEEGLLRTEDINESQSITIYALYTTGEVSVQGEKIVRVSLPCTWHVPADFNTIQGAIDAAQHRDAVVVADGVYQGAGNRDIDFLGKTISVISQNGPESCIIDVNGSETDPHRGFYFHSGEDTNSFLYGLTIINGYQNYGGGIFCDGGEPTISNCVIFKNWGEFGGGVFCSLESTPRFRNCVIAGNSSIRGGGIYCYKGTSVENCTICGNHASQAGGGFFYVEGHDIPPPFPGQSWVGPFGEEIRNCIIRNNLAGSGSQLYGLAIPRYSCIQDWDKGGQGNVNGDPCFVEAGYWDANGVWVDGDYHLLPTSPCIDAGMDAGIYEDIEGNPRPIDYPDIDNNGELPEFDMGAYEMRMPPLEVAMHLTPQVLNPERKGKWIKAHFVLPEGYEVNDVNVNSPAMMFPLGIESEYMNVFVNEEGFVEIEIGFGRSDLCAAATDNDAMEVTVVGLLMSGREFAGTDTIRIIAHSMEYLGVLASYWLETSCRAPDWCNGADIDRSGTVDLSDFALFDGCCVEVF